VTPKIFLIEWEDSESTAEWCGINEWKTGLEFKIAKSIGFVLLETDKGIALGLSWDSENKNANPVKYIPWSAIINMWEVVL